MMSTWSDFVDSHDYDDDYGNDGYVDYDANGDNDDDDNYEQ